MQDPEYKFIKGQGWVPYVEAVYDPNDYSMWKTQDGQVLRLTDMGYGHLVNARKMVARWLYKLRFCGWCLDGSAFGNACIMCSPERKVRYLRRIDAFDAEIQRRDRENSNRV